MRREAEDADPDARAIASITTLDLQAADMRLDRIANKRLATRSCSRPLARFMAGIPGITPFRKIIQTPGKAFGRLSQADRDAGCATGIER